MDRTLLTQTISKLEQNISDLKSILSGDTCTIGTDEVEGSSKNNKTKSRLSATAKLTASSLPAKDLGPIPDYQSSDWPAAVDEDMIIKKTNAAEQMFRALQIINHIKEPLNNKRVLDYGCGNGLVAAEAAHTAQIAIGYDIKEDDIWSAKDMPNLICTTDADLVAQNAPYDVIIFYDVLDHIVGQQPSDVIKHASNLLADGGIIYVRTHPWTSRTGGHVYESINKAYLHLAITPDEMAQNGIEIEPNQKIIRPMAAYELWFKDAGLSISEKKTKAMQVEHFFSDSIIDRINKINWGGKLDNDTIRKIMANHFIDYKLSKSK